MSATLALEVIRGDSRPGLDHRPAPTQLGFLSPERLRAIAARAMRERARAERRALVLGARLSIVGRWIERAPHVLGCEPIESAGPKAGLPRCTCGRDDSLRMCEIEDGPEAMDAQRDQYFAEAAARAQARANYQTPAPVGAAFLAGRCTLGDPTVPRAEVKSGPTVDEQFAATNRMFTRLAATAEKYAAEAINPPKAVEPTYISPAVAARLWFPQGR